MTSSHRRAARPRYGRLAALVASVSVSVLAALAGLGVIAGGPAPAGAAQGPSAHIGDETPPAAQPTTRPTETTTPTTTPTTPTALPAGSGAGRRIVLSLGGQRVWLMGRRAGDVQRTYLISGSVVDNLQPGTYAVTGKSRTAVGVDDPGVARYVVAFTSSPTGAAIAFETIPIKNGVPLQTRAELGTPQSHGGIRQSLPDARALWSFAGVGTKVVVVA